MLAAANDDSFAIQSATSPPPPLDTIIAPPPPPLVAPSREKSSYASYTDQVASVSASRRKSFQLAKANSISSRHAFSDAEKSAFVRHINATLKHDEALRARLPIDPASDAIFDAIRDGILLWCDLWIFCGNNLTTRQQINQRVRLWHD
jgi:hypothetical protein